MGEAACSKCGNPLKVISGGDKSEEGSTKIQTIHIFGCINPDCDIKLQEQARNVTERDSFNG